MLLRALLTAAVLLVAAGPPLRGQPATTPFGDGLLLPIDCQLGVTCWVMNYFDADSSPATHDFRAGGRSYNGHTGVDFAIRDEVEMARGVNVLAAAAGTVAAVRDGETDGALLARGKAAIAGRECGNMAALIHGDGWVTQYCHMRRGSVAVKVGDRVAAGQMLGLVGLSGETAYPHVHIQVRWNNVDLDPFTGAAAGPCCTAISAPRPLWSPAARIAPENIELLSSGFTTQAQLSTEMIRKKALGEAVIGRDAPQLQFFAAMWGIDAKDRLLLKVFLPDGREVAAGTRVFDKPYAIFVQPMPLANRLPKPWPSGRYRGVATVEHDTAGGVWRRTLESEVEIK